MKVTIRDPETFLAIPPLEVVAYLRARGWREIHRVPDMMSVWRHGEQADRGPEVLVPLNRTLRDFALRMSDTLSVLEMFENRSQLDVLRDILNTTGDLIRVRLSRHDAESGSVPLEVGVNFIQGVRDMLSAAACATVIPKPYFQARRPGAAAAYLDKVRLGQTEQGSYVVTVLSKVSPDLQMQLLEEGPEEPFERRVVVTLANSLEAIREAADTAATGGGIDAFQQAIPLGVSANLCEAVSAIGDGGASQVDVSFTWSPVRPVAGRVPNHIAFPHDAVEYIKEAGRILKGTAPIEDFELSGVVTRLERQPHAGPGTVVILGFVDGQPKHVRVELNEHDYEVAARAHVDRRGVICRGDLVREGKGFVLGTPRDLLIVAEPIE